VLGTATGVAVSEDAGSTWRESRDGLQDATISVDPNREPIPADEIQRDFGINDVVIDPTHPEQLYAGTVNGLHWSPDDGATWQRLTSMGSTVTVLVIPAGGDRLLFEAESGVFVLPT
jgi:hypothetical protein